MLLNINYLGLILSLSYILVGIMLFALNYYIFKNYSKLDVDNELFNDRNIALGSIIRGQLIGQAIMIGSLMYYLGLNLEGFLIIGGNFGFLLLKNSLYLIFYGLFGIFFFQITIYIIGKFISLEKEILIDQNQAIGKIIEGVLISISILLSVAIYSY